MNTIKMDLFKHFGLFMLYNMSNFTNITADITIEPPDYNSTDLDNIMMTSLWALSAYSCGSVITHYKNKKEVPFEIYKNEYDQKYQLYVKDNNNLKGNLEKMQKDINELKRIIDKQKKEHDEYFAEEHKEKNNIIDVIEDDIVYKYGKGQIRYEIDDKYYHGVGVNETWKWNKDNKYDKCFFEYIPDKKLPSDGKDNKLNTYNAEEFCSCCLLDDERTGRKKNYKVYKCLGHIIN